MKSINKNVRTVSIIVGLTFLMLGLLFCYFKGFNWNHPLLILFLPLWTIGIIWIVSSGLKKYYIIKSTYLPANLDVRSQSYLDSKLKWQRYVLFKILQHNVYFGVANAIMFLIYLLDFSDGRSGIFHIIFFGVLALISLVIGILFKYYIRHEKTS